MDATVNTKCMHCLLLLLSFRTVSIDWPVLASQASQTRPHGLKTGSIVLVSPRLTYPALVPVSGTLEVHLKGGNPIPGNIEACLEPVSRTMSLPCVPLERVPGNVTKLAFRVPPTLGPDHYDLVLSAGTGQVLREPSCVRIYRPEGDFWFAVVADQQIGDPTAALEQGDMGTLTHPSTSSLAFQLQDELELIDPVFVLNVGDLVFGMDYESEFEKVRKFWAGTRAAVFAVPGNHDGYSLKRLALSPYWQDAAGELFLCAKILLEPGLDDDQRAWGLVKCLLKSSADLFVVEEVEDGLDVFRAKLGPVEPRFTFGNIEFLGINTYQGSKARRTAVALPLAWSASILDVLSRLIPGGSDQLQSVQRFLSGAGAPLVENYGGFMTLDSVQRLGDYIDKALSRNKEVVVFGHHDPGGNTSSRTKRYKENREFFDNPFGLGTFQVWNYDNTWDSDPADRNKMESKDRNSGTALMKALAKGVSYYFFGHGHEDMSRFTARGGRIAGFGPTAGKDIWMIQTTTAGASVRGNGYRGYRLVHVNSDKIESFDFMPQIGLHSVPLANLRQVRQKLGNEQSITILNSLPIKLKTRTRFLVPLTENGYEFGITGGTGRLHHVSVFDWDESLAAALYLDVEVPGSSRSPKLFEQALSGNLQQPELAASLSAAASQVEITCRPSKGNKSPVGILTVESGLPLVKGETAILSSRKSRDPDHDRLPFVFWRIGGKRILSGRTVSFVPEEHGTLQVELLVLDEHGGYSKVVRRFEVEEPSLLSRLCRTDTSLYLAWGTIFLLLILLLWISAGRTRPANDG